MMTILIAVARERLDPAQLAVVQRLAPDARVVVTDDRAEIEAIRDEVEIVAGWLPSERVLAMPRLRWFQAWSAGADWLLEHPEAVEAEWRLTNTSGLHAIPISEHIFAMLLALARRLPEAVAAQQRHEWWAPAGETLWELAAKTLLLVGVGAIGERTAQVAQGLGMRVWGVRRHPEQGVPGVERMEPTPALPDLLPDADIVVLTLPLTEETRGIIGEDELRRMKPSAVLVNIGRGGLIDEASLIRALQEGWIAAAALDVFEEEPLPDASPLWAMDNVLITAHYAGANPHYHQRAMRIFLDNLRRFQAGEPLRNEVDKTRGY